MELAKQGGLRGLLFKILNEAGQHAKVIRIRLQACRDAFDLFPVFGGEAGDDEEMYERGGERNPAGTTGDEKNRT